MDRQKWLISAVIAVVVAAGATTYLMMSSDAPDTGVAPITGAERAEQARGVIADLERSRAQSASPARAPAGGAVDTRAGGAGAVAPAAPADVPTGAATDIDTAFERAQAFQQAGQLADAQLLYFYAAREGHAGSAFALAELNDPNHHSPETSLLAEPDAFQAYRWYSQARERGYPGAAERLDALRAWAVTASEAGDFEAEQLLLQWK